MSAILASMLTSECLAETRADAERMESWGPGDSECSRCSAPIALNPGSEPSPLCHGCAHMIVADVPGLVGHIDALQERMSKLEATLTEACDHLTMAVDYLAMPVDGDEDMCVLDPEGAQKERDWIERARAIAKGSTP